MRTVIDERYSSYDGFLLAGELNEQYYLEQWRDTVVSRGLHWIFVIELRKCMFLVRSN